MERLGHVHGLHGGVEAPRRVTPVRPARDGPFVRRLHARIERGTKLLEPFERDGLSKQRVAVPLEWVAIEHGFRVPSAIFRF
jgi:hypothetical protein